MASHQVDQFYAAPVMYFYSGVDKAVRLAKQYGRYGYRKIGELLRIEGWQVNHKKVERLWREEGLQIPQRHRKRKRASTTRTALSSGGAPDIRTISGV